MAKMKNKLKVGSVVIRVGSSWVKAGVYQGEKYIIQKICQESKQYQSHTLNNIVLLEIGPHFIIDSMLLRKA